MRERITSVRFRSSQSFNSLEGWVGLKFGGKRIARGYGGLPGMVVAGILVAISAAGALGSVGSWGAAAEAEQWMTTVPGSHRHLREVSVMTTKENAAGCATPVFSSMPEECRPRIPRECSLALGPLVAGFPAEGTPWAVKRAGISQMRENSDIYHVEDGLIRPEEKSFPFSFAVVDDSRVVGSLLDGHSGVEDGTAASCPSIGDDEQVAVRFSGGKERITPASPGAEAEEPAQPGLVVGLLCVVAAAGALAGRYAGYPVGGRRSRTWRR